MRFVGLGTILRRQRDMGTHLDTYLDIGEVWRGGEEGGGGG